MVTRIEQTVGLVLGVAIAAIAFPAQAMNTVRQHSSVEAFGQTLSVPLFAGRASVIDFRNGEVISFVQVSDPRYVLFSLNAPVESGQAKSIILRRSTGIDFPNLSRGSRPNLIVTTLTPTGESRTYSFNLELRSGQPTERDTGGIAIADQPLVPPQPTPRNTLLPTLSTSPPAPVPAATIQTRLGGASLEDLEQGLSIALTDHYTTAQDPVVFRVRELLARSRNGEPLLGLAQAFEIPLSVLTSLGELALQRSTQARTIPVSSEVTRPFTPTAPSSPTHDFSHWR